MVGLPQTVIGKPQTKVGSPRTAVGQLGHVLQRTVVGPVAVAFVAGAGALVLQRFDPNEAGHYPSCPFLLLTGLFCPGCGSTRMLHALTEGDLAGALAMNPLAVALLPVLGLYYVDWTRRVLTAARRRSTLPAAAVWAFLVLVVAFGIARNLPAGTWLAPG